VNERATGLYIDLERSVAVHYFYQLNQLT